LCREKTKIIRVYSRRVYEEAEGREGGVSSDVSEDGVERWLGGKPVRIHPELFKALIVDETYEDATRKKLNFYLFKWEQEELDRLTENQFRINYEQEYKQACEQAAEEWDRYHQVEIIDEQQLYQYKSFEVDDALKTRWNTLREQIEREYIEKIELRLFQAMNRREQLKPKYQTKAMFLVKSKGEQITADTLFDLVQQTHEQSGHKLSLLYEALVRIPEEDVFIIPDFVLLEVSLVIEYAGLSHRNYKIGFMLKMEALRKLGVPVVVIRPEDLDNIEYVLRQKLKFYDLVNR